LTVVATPVVASPAASPSPAASLLPSPLATVATTSNSPWVELGLGPAPMGTDAEVRRAIDDMVWTVFGLVDRVGMP